MAQNMFNGPNKDNTEALPSSLGGQLNDKVEVKRDFKEVYASFINTSGAVHRRPR